jgi:hypothetical protein
MERNACKFESNGEFDVKDACKVFLGVWRRSTEVWRNM